MSVAGDVMRATVSVGGVRSTQLSTLAAASPSSEGVACGRRHVVFAPARGS